ncbi:carbohydrate porin [Pseudomonas sp. LRF_L74]|uniref:carbohydrate porin n=1 Tax=Pseudomonas sp. LRF_L74 TaxID=3369422 RepID=UPI003F60C8E3
MLGSTQASAANAFASDSHWMLGDWNGMRSELAEEGIDFNFDYVGEIGSNLGGGYNSDRTARYSDQYTIGAHFDLQRLFGWHEAEFQFAINNRNGDNISGDRVGDPRVGTLSSSQEVWGRGSHWRMTQLWYRQKFFDQQLDVKAGRFGIGEDFNSFACDFQNLTFCGSQAGNWGGIWYNWPVTQWGIRIKYQLVPELYAQMGAFEQNPSNTENDNGFKLSGSGTRGAVIPVEVVWTPHLHELPGEYRAGYYYSSASASDVYKDATGQSAAFNGAAYRSASSKHGVWIGALQQVTQQGGDASRGLSLFLMATAHDKKTSKVDHYVSAGAVYKGLFYERPHDDIGIAFSLVHINPAYRKNSEAINQANTVYDYDDPTYLPVQDTEYNAELNYGVHVTNWLTVRPNLQYVRHPGGVNQVDDAWVGGLKILSSF